MYTCFICSKNENNLTYVLGIGKDSQNNIISKFKNFVPEVEWSFDFRICSDCIKDLDKACKFKQQCTHSYLFWKNKEEAYDTEYEPLEDDFHQKAKSIDSDSSREIYDINRGLKNCKDKPTVTKTDFSVNKDDGKDTIFLDKLNPKNQVSNILPACELCGTTFKNGYLLKRHCQNVHAKEKKFTCDICDKTFVSIVYLNAHKKYHSGTRPHICSFCGKSFITASDLYHHEKIHANKRAYQCEICPKAFNTSSDLYKHKVCVHTDREEWKYICPFCDKRFPLKVNLDSHIKTHTGEKNFSCHLCYRKCINKSILTRHIETHTNAISFRCDVCFRGYKYKKSLNEHKAKVHKVGELNISPKIRKFVCHLCSKSYYANNKLQKHLRIHSGEKPFECPHCHKCFADKSYVKQHLKIIHDVNMDINEI